MNRDDMIKEINEAVDFIYKNHHVKGMGLSVYSKELVDDLTKLKTFKSALKIWNEAVMLHSPLIINIVKLHKEDISDEKDIN